MVQIVKKKVKTDDAKSKVKSGQPDRIADREKKPALKT